jgi:hypothetical protein
VTAGNIREGRSYLRWENPILGINGEGRVTPIMPGCQVIYTVIGPDGVSLAYNTIGRSPPFTEGGGEEGQRGMDMAPAQPHTTGRRARRCESCHANPKTLGYGIDEGEYLLGYTEDRVVDLRDADGNLIPSRTTIQMAGVPDLPMDLAQVVNPETGEQMMTIGSHWPDSGPLSANQREKMERAGACMGCHQNMDDPAFWNDQVMAFYGEIIANEDHIEHMDHLLQDAVSGKVALAEVGDAKAKAQNLEAELIVSEERRIAAEMAQTPAPDLNTLFISLALAAGLLIGGGIIFATSTRISPREED